MPNAMSNPALKNLNIAMSRNNRSSADFMQSHYA